MSTVSVDDSEWTSFPTDLHSYLEPSLPGINLNTHIYPTYKAKRPIADAVAKLLRWIDTLTPGKVILTGHSLGGYLVADAAVINARQADSVHPIIGILAMDVPYLGVHPHVIVSGLASLFAGERQPEAEVNDTTKVDIAPRQSVDDVSLNNHRSPTHSQNNRAASPAASESEISKTFKFLSRHAHDKHPFSAAYQWVSDYFEFGSAVIDREGLNERFTALTKWGGDWVHFYTHTVPEGDEGTKCSITSSFRSLKSFELPHIGGLKLETQPFHPEHHAGSAAEGSALEFDLFKAAAAKAKAKMEALSAKKNRSGQTHLEVPSPERWPSEESTQFSDVSQRSTSPTPSTRSSSSQLSLSRPPSIALDELPPKQPRKHLHRFIVLPLALTPQWQSVPIAGVDNEVAAHTGIFFRHQNLEYDSFVPRVGSQRMSFAK
ncbi:uncharacterized protein EI90DRAFT_3019622 [Cantharellus anzutake]|uniref:uncharacterized protein n=1 Tax=Cantharellus anzutake TaxID=1750568 RepID=UPI001908270A|nr:uncharacterized protein EI90DRAFT_3019622 [Cantharellus anzutake]KAF8324251.1 hypothetical protein EI90DRAFT_3019622 [Cantharellus anzutake]